MAPVAKPASPASDGRLVLALPKGRIYEDIAPLFARAGLPLPDPKAAPRALRFQDPEWAFEVLLLRGHDVPTFVSQGAAHLGVAGLDVLLEQDLPLYAPLDLDLGLCALCVAGTPVPGGGPWDPRRAARGRPLRVATKFPRIAANYFAEQSVPCEVVPLHGNIELAPLVGMADCVVDLVSTGETLRKNGMVVYAEFLRVSSRLICNRAAYRLRHGAIATIIAALRQELHP